MSYYTTQLRFVLEKIMGLHTSPPNYQYVNEIIDATWNKAFGNYPIFDEKYRETLNKKILLHFYQQEIGFETPGEFLFRLNIKMNEIMPYYNKLYQSELLDIDPFKLTHMVEKYQGEDKYNRELKHGHKISETDNENVSRETSGSHDVKTTDTGTQDTTQNGTQNVTDTATGKDTETIALQDKHDGSNHTTLTTNSSTTSTGSNTHSGENEYTDTTTDDNESLNRYLDTPEGRIENMLNENYLTDIRKIEEDNKRTLKHKGTDSSTDTSGGSETASGTSSGSETINETIGKTGTDVHDTTNNSTSNMTTSQTGKVTHNNNGSNIGTNSENESQERSASSDILNSGSDFNSHVGSDAYIRETYGYANFDKIDMLQKLRNSFLNIDMMIINELNILFMQIY